ncbi:MAG: mercury resistance protein [bacterium]
MKGLMGKVLVGTAVVTCPCHLPIYLVLFGGTALGAFLSENLALSFALLTVYFAFALLLGLKCLKPRAGRENA